MNTITIGTATYKLSETSDTLAKLQKCIDGQKKKTRPPTIRKGPLREFPHLAQCETTADYVRQYYALNAGVFWAYGSPRESAVKSLFPELFQPMRDVPIPTVQGIDGIEEPSE